MKKYILIIFCALVVLSGCAKGEPIGTPGIVLSSDGVPIAYEVYPGKDPTLVFVHGWSCDSRYWKKQIPFFAKRYRTVTIDLAGHGHSGLGRTAYAMASFGEDVKAVVDAVGAKRAIKAYLGQFITRESTEPYAHIDAPITSINTDQWPTNVESNRTHIKKYDLVIIKGAGHFMMLSKPEQFNRALARAIKQMAGN